MKVNVSELMFDDWKPLYQLDVDELKEQLILYKNKHDPNDKAILGFLTNKGLSSSNQGWLLTNLKNRNYLELTTPNWVYRLAPKGTTVTLTQE